MTLRTNGRARSTSRSTRGRPGGRRKSLIGWLFVVPALAVYGLFVLTPLTQTIRYSLYRWDGVGPATWVGLGNYRTVLRDPDLVGTVTNSLRLVVFFSLVPVTLGVLAANIIHRVARGRLGTIARTVLFLPQVIPLVAAGIIWGWLLSLSGLVNQLLDAVGLDGLTRAWLGDFDWALPAVGMIGVWVLLGFCTVLLLTGMSKIDVTLYEAARIDGAGWWAELRAITLPGLRYEIGVCLTVTMIAALAAFDIVYVSTGGGPGNATAVPGIQIYILAFLERQVGLASALAVIVMLLVLVIILPIQRLTRRGAR
ncbi:carbohydrate ABC transporter permease [Desertimonas flava]|uniref:carbohydrate ABC transporter permease n=1 Tax=Desertimonas flava TaxID=2064846 RepID=UPI000E346260|nr:sugar ABC transporter permease [Desertimonas flava]